MEPIPRFLSRTALFGGLTEAERAELSAIATVKRPAKDEIIFWEGDPGDGFYVLMEGRVKVFKSSADGKEKILHILDPGQPFGEVPVFAGQRFPAHAQAMTSCRLLFFPRQAFVDLIRRNPSLSLNMLAVLSRRLREFTIQIESLSLKEVPARLASYLVYLAGREENRREISLSISKGQLASLLGTVPETLSRIFSKMTGDGLIEMKGRRIRLLDREALEDLADPGRSTERVLSGP